MNSSHSPALSDTEEADTQKPSPRRYVVLLAALLSVLAAAYYTFFVNPLASDEEMIAHFNAHRAEIEALVKSYREWEPTPGENVIWNHKPETKRLLERAGVWAVSDIAPIWFDDPYSIEGAARFDVLLRAGTPKDISGRSGRSRCFFLEKSTRVRPSSATRKARGSSSDLSITRSGLESKTACCCTHFILGGKARETASSTP